MSDHRPPVPALAAVGLEVRRGDRLAVLFEAGVTCPDVKDTPTTLVVYDAW